MHPDEECEVLIVGAGAAGCAYAARLAAAERRVVVLEAGPTWTLGDLVSSQLWARRLKWGGVPVIVSGDPPFAHNVNHGSGIGGAALHHYATWLRLVPETFELAERYQRGLDWPFGYGELRPWYDRVQAEAGVSGDASLEPWRPAGDPYPMPPLQRSVQGGIVAAGFEAQGLAVSPLPVAINSVPYKGRPACLYDAWCDAGCPIGALFNPLVLHLPQALRAGAQVRPNSTVIRVRTDSAGHARVVEYVEQGTPRRIAAQVVILAASVIQNARILLNSGTTAHPRGLANSSGMVGANLMIECMALCYGLFDRDTQPHRGVNAGDVLHQSAWEADGRPFGAYHWQGAPAMKPNDLFGIAATRADLFGQELVTFLGRATRRLGALVGFGGGTGQPHNRVVLDTESDAFGVPKARVESDFDRESLALWQHMLDEGERVLAAGGAQQIWSGPLLSGHLSGGTIMGDDPARSVTDGYGRCHDVPNLIVAGAGLFPQSGSCNPTFTVYALTERSVAHMLGNWSDYAA